MELIYPEVFLSVLFCWIDRLLSKLSHHRTPWRQCKRPSGWSKSPTSLRLRPSTPSTPSYTRRPALAKWRRRDCPYLKTGSTLIILLRYSRITCFIHVHGHPRIVLVMRLYMCIRLYMYMHVIMFTINDLISVILLVNAVCWCLLCKCSVFLWCVSA